MSFTLKHQVRLSSKVCNLLILLFCLAVHGVFAATEDAQQKSVKKNGYAAWPFPILFLIFIVSVLLSAMFAGLTIGLFGMDFIMLEIVASAGNEPECTYAKQIMPIRRYGHQLLATLLIGNMLTMVIVSQMVAAMIQSTDMVHFIVATVVIFIFAEIIPMATCSNGTYALYIGAKSAPIVSVALIILYPVAKPLGMFLECIVKHDDGLVYDRKEMKKLIQVHCEKHGEKSGLGADEMRMMIGALDMQEVNLKEILTPMQKVVLIDGDLPVTRQLLEKLWSMGKSRIPVYTDGTRSRIIGVLFLKDLLGLAVRPLEAPLRVRDVLTDNPRRLIVVPDSMRLQELLRVFQSNQSQLLFVERMDSEFSETRDIGASSQQRSPRRMFFTPKSILENPEGLGNRIVGIVTLEDVLERILNTDIYDEYDMHAADFKLSTSKEKIDKEKGICHRNCSSNGVDRSENNYDSDDDDGDISDLQSPPRPIPNVNFYSYSPENTGGTMTEEQKWVLARFLVNSYISFASWRLPHVKFLLDRVGDIMISTPSGNVDWPVLYRRGERSDVFTLLLGGGVRSTVGVDGFTVEKRSFSDFGVEVLINGDGFVPDYTAIVSQPSRLLRLTLRDLLETEECINDMRCRAARPPRQLVLRSASCVTVRSRETENVEGRRFADGEELPVSRRD